MLHFWFDALRRHNAKQHEFPRVGACWRCHSDQPTQLQHAPGIRPITQNSMNFQCLAAVAHERRAICFVALCGTCRKHNEFKGFWQCWWIPGACWSCVGWSEWHRQHAPTRENSNVFRHVVEELCCIFGSTHCVATTRNSMNSHVLAHVGGAI